MTFRGRLHAEVEKQIAAAVASHDERVSLLAALRPKVAA